MALWNKNMQLTPSQKEQRRKKREERIIRRNSFYTGETGARANESIECASNRRAAGKYVPNF